MGNTRNWARRSKKSNNWKVVMKIRQEKKKISNSGNNEDVNLHQLDSACHSRDLTQAEPDTSPYLPEIPIIDDKNDGAGENPNNSIKRKRTNDHKECTFLPQECENYFACLAEDDDDNVSIDSNKMTNAETQSLIDPLLFDDTDTEDLDEDSHENDHDENSDENTYDEDRDDPATEMDFGDQNLSASDEEEVVLEVMLIVNDLEREKISKCAAYMHGDGCEDLDMEPSEFDKAKKVLLEKLKNYQRNRQSVEVSTRGGKFNSRWQQIRQDLLPSPFFSRIVKTKQRKTYTKVLEELMYTRSEFGNNAEIKHQRLVARDALKLFENLFDEHTVMDCGIFIDAKLYYLCASPYKLYGNDHILSIKCPLKQYRRKFDDVLNQIPFWKNEAGYMNLNKQHEWYIELQSELCITGRKFGFLMVWLGEFEGEPQYRIVEVPRDNFFFEKEIKPKLVYFYEEVMMKELVDSRKQRGMKLRQYDSENNSFI